VSIKQAIVVGVPLDWPGRPAFADGAMPPTLCSSVFRYAIWLKPKKTGTARSEVINIQQSNNVIIHASHNADTCLTSSQWCQYIINSFLVGMQVAWLKCSDPLVEIGFSFFSLKATATQQLFHLRNGDFRWAYHDTSRQTTAIKHALTFCLTAVSELMLGPSAKQRTCMTN